MRYDEIREYDNDVQFEIGHRIQEARYKKGMKGVEVAAFLNIGSNQYSRIENGRAGCTVSQLFMLAQLLECSADYLIFGYKDNGMTEEQERVIKTMVMVFGM